MVLLACWLMSATLNTTASPEMPIAQAPGPKKAMTVAQVSDYLSNRTGRVTVKDLEKLTGIRPAVVAPGVHRWVLANGVLDAVLGPGPEGQEVIRCWGRPPDEIIARAEN